MSALPSPVNERNQLRTSTCFMALPLEVRQLIYRELRNTDAFPSHIGSGDTGLSLQGFIHSGVVNANRQTRNEALGVVFDKTLVFSCYGYTRTPSRLPTFPLSMLKHVKLDYCVMNRMSIDLHPLERVAYPQDGGLKSALLYLIRLGVSLRTLEISFYLSSECRLEDAKVFV